MSKLTYGVYHKTLKKYLAKRMPDIEIAYLLFDSVIFPTDLKNKMGEYYSFDKQTVSFIVNGKGNIPQKIKAAASTRIIYDEIYTYFDESVLSKVSVGMESVPVNELKTIIENDGSITDEIRDALLSKAVPGKYNEFLADTFLYTLKVDNKQSTKSEYTKKSDKETPLVIETVPDDISDKELPYVNAIFEAYGDREKIENFNESSFDKYPRYKENFNRQRKTYYAAETLRMRSRDAYNDDESAFDELKQETYDGIIDKWEMDYPDGYQRMSDVLAQASQINYDSTLLTKETSWVTINTKKGLCHVLVNENELSGWVKK